MQPSRSGIKKFKFKPVVGEVLRHRTHYGFVYFMTYSEKLKDPRWQKKRLKILERDQFFCKICYDDKATLHVHHLKYEKGKEPWEVGDEFLITLCDKCHYEEELEIKKSIEKLIDILKSKGFMSNQFYMLSDVLDKIHYGWGFYEPNFSIIGFSIDESQWEILSDSYWENISNKSINGGKV